MSESESTGPDFAFSGTDGEDLVLELLGDRDGPVTVGELSEAVSARIEDVDTEDVVASGDVHEALTDQVLPALDDQELIEFDTERGLVSTAADADAGLLARFLDLSGLSGLSRL